MSAADRDGGGMTRRDEMEALLPFYLNGTLDGADLAAVEAWLAGDPVAAIALEEAEREFSGTTAANEAIRPPADALSRFSKALDAEAGPARAAAAPGFWARLTALPAGFAWAVAAAAVALLLVQAVTSPRGGGSDVEIAGTEQAGLPFVLVTFKPDARLSDVSAFLAEQGATIVSGPAPGGIYKIGIPALDTAGYDRIAGLIAAQPFVEAVIPGRKPDNGG